MLIFGLGNPGEEYENTRHNTGRIILLFLAKKNLFSDWKKDLKSKSLLSSGKIGSKRFDFIMPETFMNNSGQAVFTYVNNKKDLEKVIIIHDDIDLPLGSIKISFNKSSGGHRGVESIIKKVKSQEFIRIRVGVSQVNPKGVIKKPIGEEKVLKFLLGKFKDEEIKLLKKLSLKINDALVVISTEGRQKAMSLFNSN